MKICHLLIGMLFFYPITGECSLSDDELTFNSEEADPNTLSPHLIEHPHLEGLIIADQIKKEIPYKKIKSSSKKNIAKGFIRGVIGGMFFISGEYIFNHFLKKKVSEAAESLLRKVPDLKRSSVAYITSYNALIWVARGSFDAVVTYLGYRLSAFMTGPLE